MLESLIQKAHRKLNWACVIFETYHTFGIHILLTSLILICYEMLRLVIAKHYWKNCKMLHGKCNLVLE